MDRTDQLRAFDETVKTISSIIEWGDVPLSKREMTQLKHIKGMRARITDDFDDAKIGRWLGWVQGVSCAHGWLLLDDCIRINKNG